MKALILALIFFAAINFSQACTETTVSGTKAPATGSFCSGDLIFEDNFDFLDHEKWHHEVTMAGGGNYEFQWYVNDRFNSYTTGGIFHIKPTFTSDIFGENFLTSGRVVIPEWECSDGNNNGCDKTGTPDYIINPIRSALVNSWEAFAFKYGTVEIRAKLPAGDWLWPALWLMPKWSVYGGWPRSGEIDMVESRGNRELYSADGNTQVGNRQVESTLHFGPAWNVNGFWNAHGSFQQSFPFSNGFQVYKFIWHPGFLQFWVDGNHVLTVDANDGFWDRGGFWNSGFENPWAGRPAVAPFDQEFYFILNLAIGGNFFADDFDNRNGGKPWVFNTPRAMTDFWNGRAQWESSWNRNTDDSHLQIDYIRVWAL